ncbi:hypothetical protein [Xylophilus sp.]|uniref:hypothetical protein n=1 Tax=Xylophilus sp. TaxID=2653893 RepID=UPI0013BC9C6D|nr:hypothetical protein [Xylophilus sp.]KAF1049315.1 MAG: hypothetical protein GAK38_00771 [Xylophilus sp.]
MQITENMLSGARKALSRWTLDRAHRLAKDVGFSYEPVSEGYPETYEAVAEEFRQCNAARRGFRVWAGASDKTIYTSAEANWAFRYIHDVYHAAFRHDFTTAGEFATAVRHVDEVSKAFGADSLEARLIWIDTVGQVQHFAETGGFIDDQLQYARDRLASLVLL